VECLEVEYVDVDPIDITGGVTEHTCPNENCGAISITITGGSGDISISWSGPGNDSASDQLITNLGAGTYTVTVTDDCTGSATATFVVEDSEEVDVIQREGCWLERICRNSEFGCFLEIVLTDSETSYEEDDCRYEITKCIDSEDLLGEGAGHVYDEIRNKTSEWVIDVESCQKYETCSSGDIYKPTVIEGEIETIQQSQVERLSDGSADCFFCLKRTICRIDGEETRLIEEEDLANCTAPNEMRETTILWCDWNDNLRRDEGETIDIFVAAAPDTPCPDKCHPSTVPLPSKHKQEEDLSVRGSYPIETRFLFSVFPNPTHYCPR
jgi:hypothetical protein